MPITRQDLGLPPLEVPKPLITEDQLDDMEIQVWSSAGTQHPVLSVYWGDPPNEHIMYVDIEVTPSDSMKEVQRLLDIAHPNG